MERDQELARTEQTRKRKKIRGKKGERGAVLSREFLCGWRDGEFESRIFNAFLNVDGILWREHDLLLWNNIYDRNARNIDEFLRLHFLSRL